MLVMHASILLKEKENCKTAIISNLSFLYVYFIFSFPTFIIHVIQVNILWLFMYMTVSQNRFYSMVLVIKLTL